MWTDRFTAYYSKETHFAVRWLHAGQRDDEAEYRKFDDKAEAERFYDDKVAEGDHRCRVELFVSQAKWIRYRANLDEFGNPAIGPEAKHNEQNLTIGD